MELGFRLVIIYTAVMRDESIQASGIESVITDEKTFSAVYKFLVQYTENPIWICNNAGETIFVNDHFQKLTGYSLKDMVGKSSLDFYEKKYHPNII